MIKPDDMIKAVRPWYPNITTTDLVPTLKSKKPPNQVLTSFHSGLYMVPLARLPRGQVALSEILSDSWQWHCDRVFAAYKSYCNESLMQVVLNRFYAKSNPQYYPGGIGFGLKSPPEVFGQEGVQNVFPNVKLFFAVMDNNTIKIEDGLDGLDSLVIEAFASNPSEKLLSGPNFVY